MPAAFKLAPGRSGSAREKACNIGGFDRQRTFVRAPQACERRVDLDASRAKAPRRDRTAPDVGEGAIVRFGRVAARVVLNEQAPPEVLGSPFRWRWETCSRYRHFWQRELPRMPQANGPHCW